MLPIVGYETDKTVFPPPAPKKPRRRQRSARGVAPLWTGAEWTRDLIDRVYDQIETIALGEMGLSIYPNQIEIINSEQMLDAYASIGMPIFYHHWSFGKQFARQEALYRTGRQGLAYEIVINSNPCINYLMEENTMTMQALVTAHAAFGHNHFFKNNYAFQQWTDASSIIDYLIFARDYIKKQEGLHGQYAVERLLDSCHALMSYGVDRAKRARRLSLRRDQERQAAREAHYAAQASELDRLFPKDTKNADAEQPFPPAPEENLLYFCEKYSPAAKPWQREIMRIVRKVAQYFYPQGQTKLMNEGFATKTHYDIMTKLHDRGLMTHGAFVEFLHSHTDVVCQPSFNDPRYNGINVYALGFAMLRDIERMCLDPTDEDRAFRPNLAGEDPQAVILDAVANYRDESFVRQYLSPRLIREWRMFNMRDDYDAPMLEITSIHNERGYDAVRERLAESYEPQFSLPNIEVVKVDPRTRELTLRYTAFRDRKLNDASKMMRHVAALWGEATTLIDHRGDEIGRARTG